MQYSAGASPSTHLREVVQIHDFDPERNARHAAREAEFGERTFRFGGEVFYVRANVRYPAIKRIASITTSSDGVEVFDAVEAAVVAMIDPRDNAHERFRKVCESDIDPVTFEDLAELQNWLVREATTRPPTQPDSSADSQSTPGTSLTDVSSIATDSA